jgi:hypothetical protein
MLYNTISEDNGETWYMPHVEALIKNGIIPSLSNPNEFETR